MDDYNDTDPMGPVWAFVNKHREAHFESEVECVQGLSTTIQIKGIKCFAGVLPEVFAFRLWCLS